VAGVRFERESLSELMARHGDNLAEAERVAGLELKYRYRLLDKWGIARR